MGLEPPKNSLQKRCIHTHPIKRDQDIRNAVSFGVRTFVADNPDEIRKFARYTDSAELLLRVSFRSPGAVCDLSPAAEFQDQSPRRSRPPHGPGPRFAVLHLQ